MSEAPPPEDLPVYEPAQGLTLAAGSLAEAPLIVITGMSGAGRSTAAKVLEDLGWYVVDNLPPQMLGELQDLRRRALRAENGEVPRLAVVIDARTRSLSDHFAAALGALRRSPERPVLVYLDATDEALVRRFESVRRPHPLQAHGRLLDGIQAERALMSDLRAVSDLILDTSGLNIHQFSGKIASLLDASLGSRVRVAVMSFGFKYGVPLDADFVMDMRFLPNPFWDPALRGLTGQDPAVAEFVLRQEGAVAFLERAVAMLSPVVDGYLREGRRYATVAVGCTGGKHRSVTMTEQLSARLGSDRVDAFVVHRDLGRE